MRIAASILFLVVAANGENWNWRGTAPLNQGRSDACIVRLADGRVQVSGGSAAAALSSVEMYQPAPDEIFTPIAPLNAARSGHGCTLLNDGRVLVAGGGAAGVELYEPSLDTWTLVESSILRKAGTTLLPLADGRVLITGGQVIDLEIFDPETSSLSVLPIGVTVRERHSVTMLRDGRVLFAGGRSEQGALSTAEMFDPETQEVMPVPALSAPRMGHTATLLLDGRVLLAGGSNGQSEVKTLEVYIPETNRFETLVATLKEARQSHVALLVPTNGNVLLAGGLASGSPLATSELFNPADDSILEAGSLTAPRSAVAGVLLEDGTILATGGRDADGPSVACGLLPSPSFRFTQTVYHPLERAVVSGSLGISGVNVRVTLDLARIDATGKSTAVNSRLLNASANITNGNLPATPVVDVFRDDIGSDFVLTLRAVISPSQTVTVQSRFSAKLRTSLQVFGLTGATVAGQAIPIRAVLTADGANVNFSGPLTITVGGVTTTRSLSAVAASFATEVSICCPSVGSPNGGGVAASNVTYGGNLFLEPSSAVGSQLIVSRIPLLQFGVPALRLATPASILVNVVPSGPQIPTQPTVVLDPTSLRPTGSVTLKVNGTNANSATLQGPSTLVVTAVPTYPSSQGTLTYTPTVVDRRAGSACVEVTYSGDSRYLSLPQAPTTSGITPTLGDGSVRSIGCSTVGPAPSVLQVVTPPSSYALGVATPLSVRLTWPNSVGIVSRNVNVLADGRPAGIITLVPDRTGLGIADGTSNIVLPFNAKTLSFAYDASGDLAASQAVSTIAMTPITTSISSSFVSNTVTNPFTIPFTLTISNRGIAIPPGTSLGGSIEFRDGETLLGTVAPPVLQSGTGISDGTSNTILLPESSITVRGALGNVIRPIGARTITVRFVGSPQFLASQTQTTLTVQ